MIGVRFTPESGPFDRPGLLSFEKNFQLSPGSTGVWIEFVFRSQKNTVMVFSELTELVGLPIEELSSSSRFPRVRKDLKRFWVGNGPAGQPEGLFLLRLSEKGALPP